MADPNWLFSFTAQSAAAVFAIVGGFIVTRVMNISSERAATVGVVFPLALLPVDSVNVWVRGLTVGLFGLGLLALVLYMAVQVRPLTEWHVRLPALFRRKLTSTPGNDRPQDREH